MGLVRPRITDYYDLPLTQAEADFAIRLLDEDVRFISRSVCSRRSKPARPQAAIAAGCSRPRC